MKLCPSITDARNVLSDWPLSQGNDQVILPVEHAWYSWGTDYFQTYTQEEEEEYLDY